MTTAAQPIAISSTEKKEALAELAKLLESEFFRGSQRACSFLKYSVQQVLAGCTPEDLKERNIGIEVFHRPPDYDTSQDNIVRVTAYDVRKRLGQYYNGSPSHDGPVFHLPVGSYAVTLEWKSKAPVLPVQAEPATPTTIDIALINAIPRPERKKRKKAFVVLLGSVAVALAGVITAVTLSRPAAPADPLQEVWAPILASQKPVLICVAQPIAYLPPVNEELYTGPSPRTGTFLPVRELFVGVGDAYALSDVAGFLSLHRKSWRLLAGNETPVQDLKSGPVVLIGAYSNQWSTNLTKNLRFVFADGTYIRDQSNPSITWRLSNRSLNWQTNEDYAVVSRLLDPDTGEPTVVIAGLTNAGTQAAAEFLTDPTQLADALKHVPRGWKNKNFQFVLHTNVVDGTPKRPTIVARYSW